MSPAADRLFASYAEIRWYFWSAFVRARLALRRSVASDAAMQRSPFVVRRDRLARERIYLRGRLREHPRWVQGHARLGIAELHLELLRDGPKDPRALGSVRTSAVAVRELIGPSAPQGRAALEADYLDAMLHFVSKEYSEAAAAFGRLLEPAHSAQLTEEIYWSVLEHAAAAAMVLGENERAKALFELIPERARSGEQLSAVRYLNLAAGDLALAENVPPTGGCR